MTLPANWRNRLQLPLIAAPMTLVSGPELVSAACRHGVMGSFPSHNAKTVGELADRLSRIQSELADSYRADGLAAAPLAVNLVVHHSNRRLQADLECVLAHGVELLITSVGNPAHIVEPAHTRGCLVFADVATMRHVDSALAAGVDGLVLLTAGAGGQTGWLNPFSFVHAVRERYDGPVVLAGGIADGAALWAAHVLGADLAYMGTKFIATVESAAANAYKNALVAATVDDIELTTKISGLPCNLIRRHDEPSTLLEAPAPRGFDQTQLLATRDLWSGGHSVVGVHDVPDVATMIERTQREYMAAQARTRNLLTQSNG